MAKVNKFIWFNEVQFDLTTDTVTADSLLEGVTAHSSSGEEITGTLSAVIIYTGSSVPDSSLGNNGDIYFKTE